MAGFPKYKTRPGNYWRTRRYLEKKLRRGYDVRITINGRVSVPLSDKRKRQLAEINRQHSLLCHFNVLYSPAHHDYAPAILVMGEYYPKKMPNKNEKNN